MSLQGETWLEQIPVLQQRSFTFGGEIADLELKLELIPKKPGIYLIVTDELSRYRQPFFLEKGDGGAFKGRNPNVPINTLRHKWEPRTRILYIGKAGGKSATLASRLKAYFRFGNRQPVAHWGGRYIWQLPSPKKLQVYWMELESISPEEFERELLEAFKKVFGRLPFANLRL